MEKLIKVWIFFHSEHKYSLKFPFYMFLVHICKVYTFHKKNGLIIITLFTIFFIYIFCSLICVLLKLVIFFGGIDILHVLACCVLFQIFSMQEFVFFLLNRKVVLQWCKIKLPKVPFFCLLWLSEHPLFF